MRILLIEDEAELARWLSRSLARHAGFVVEWADDGLVAERRLAIEEFDAVILDLGLPGMDGHTLLAKIRARDDRTPVLVLTARDSLAEKIGTLHQGADDFLPKPFVVEELEARLIALIRRSVAANTRGLPWETWFSRLPLKNSRSTDSPCSYPHVNIRFCEC